MQTIEIDKERKLSPSDEVLLYFRAPGATWFKSTECAIIESTLQRHKEFMITAIDYWQPGKVIFTVEVLKTNPEVVTVMFIVSAILAATGVIFAIGWAFERAELVVKAPATKAISTAALIFALLLLFSFFKGKVNVK